MLCILETRGIKFKHHTDKNAIPCQASTTEERRCLMVKVKEIRQEHKESQTASENANSQPHASIAVHRRVKTEHSKQSAELLRIQPENEETWGMRKGR
jgi:hypothetical protein